MRLLFAFVLLLGSLASLTTIDALAADPSPEATAHAEQTFQRGRELMAEGKVAEACPLFEESYATSPGLGVLLNLAGCYQSTGRIAPAYRAYRKAERLAHASHRRDREAEAHARAEGLKEKVGLVLVELPLQDQTSFTLSSDGEPIEVIAPTDPIALEPGSHLLIVTVKETRFEKRIDVVGGSLVEWEIAPRPSTSTTAPTTTASTARPVVSEKLEKPVEQPPASTRKEEHPMMIPAIAAAAGGVLGISLGTVLAIHAKNTYSDSDAHCPARGCDSEGLRLVSSARESGNLATMSFLLGGVGVAAAIVLYLISPSASSPPDKSASSWNVVLSEPVRF